MTNPTVAEYVVKRLSDLGIDKVFGVPGDYAFPIDDAIEVCPALEWVACANELNAALGDGVYGNFESLSAAACCVSALLCPDNAVDELERVIREALRLSAPAYIVIPMDYARMQIVGTPVKGLPLASIRRQSSSPAELEGALKAVLDRLKAAKNPVVLPTAIIARYGLQKKLSAFLDKSQIPYATTPMDKRVISEGHPNFLGLYNGDSSFPLKVRDAVQSADLILDLGGVIFEDLNTGLWSDAIPPDA